MAQRNYAFLSDQNLREENEDSFIIISLCPFGTESTAAVLGIADGMGGYKHGAYVSREALRRIALSLVEQLTVAPALNSFESEENFTDEVLGKALLEAVEETNIYVQRMISSNKWGKAGSTVVVAIIYGDRVVAVNLGDSPLFHYSSKNHRVTQITQDHTVAGALLRGGIISPEMARIHEGSDRLEFFLGNETIPRTPPLHKLSLSTGDLLLLCSDGISSSLSIEQITEILKGDSAGEGKDLELLAERLVEASTDAGESDNQTLILWRFENQN